MAIDTYNNEPGYFDKLETEVKDERTEIEVLEEYVSDNFNDDELTALVDSIKMRAILIDKTYKRICQIESDLGTFGQINSDERIEWSQKKKLLAKLIQDL
jgi:hypothetical protein